jgi:hypothetical protein
MGAIEQEEQFRQEIDALTEEERDEWQLDYEAAVKRAVGTDAKREAKKDLDMFMTMAGRNGHATNGAGQSAFARRRAIAAARRALEQNGQNGPRSLSARKAEKS